MSGGGITAAGILVLLLALIGLAVGLYYAYICLRSRRARRPRQHVDCEDGPLIAIDPDVNGNHEDVPVEASAPTDDDSDAKKKLIPDDTDKGKVITSESNGPLDSTPNGLTREKETILVPIEEKPEPVKLVHENETCPVVNHVAPIGFVAPIVFVAPIGFVAPANPIHKGVTTPVHPQTPRKVECAKQERAEPEVHQPVHSPVPIFVPASVVVGKKPYTDSDEEDGLLLQKCPPQDDSLDREPCLELATAPPQEIPASPSVSEQNGSPSKSSELPKSHPESIPDKDEASKHITEPTDALSEIKPEEETKPTVLLEPAVTVAASPSHERQPDEPGREESKDPTSNESLKESPQPVLMKEEVENLQPINEVSDPPAVVIIPEDLTKDDLDQNAKTDIADQLVKEPETLDSSSETDDSVPEAETAEISPDVPESTEFPGVIYLETSKPYQSDKEEEIDNLSDDDIPAKEPAMASVLDRSKSPEEKVVKNEEPTEIVPEFKPQMTSDAPPAEAPAEEVVEVPEGEIVEVAKRGNIEIPTVVIIPVASSDDLEETKAELPGSQLEPKIDIVVSEAVDEPLESALNACEAPSDVPLEAEGSYYSDSMDEGSLLEVIKEEDSVVTESDYSDTETSEPEVTQYSFDCGSLVPSTSNILADEISSTLEPEVTKYSRISELELSDHESEPLEEEAETVKPIPVISEDGADKIEGQVTVPAKQESPAADSRTLTEGNPAACSPDKVDSDAESSTTDSEGEEAEPDLKEEIVTVPTVASPPTLPPQSKQSSIDEASEADSESSDTETEGEMEAEKELVERHVVPQDETIITSSGAVPATSTPVRNKTEPSAVNSCAEPIPRVIIVNASDLNDTSSLSSSSSASDFSDEEVSDEEVTSLTTKSKIPRLVERHGS